MAAGLLLIWMQVISWWSYHYLLLFVPVGLLAVQGFESLWLTATATATPRRLRAITVAALILLIALYLRQVEPAAGLVAAVFGARALAF